MTREQPHSIESEEALIGALLLRPEVMGEVADLVGAGDFVGNGNGLLYGTLHGLWRRGVKADMATVVEELKRTESLKDAGGPGRLLELQNATPSTTNAHRYARGIAEQAMLRAVIRYAGEAADLAYSKPMDVGETLDRVRSLFAGLAPPSASVPADVWTIDDFLDRPTALRSPWVVKGLLRRGWRCMVVAPEGLGKSVLFRQIAICAAQGVHPLSYDPATPVRTLVVDLENPDDAITDICAPIRTQARHVVGEEYEPGRAWLWHRPGGINLRSRSNRAEFEAVLAFTRPDLVCLGPVYKAYRVQARENDELAAGEVQEVFDQLRTRYGFALMLEHHAPKKQQGVRELLPYGSSLWLRWPELGFKLVPEDEDGHRLKVDRWRGDRLPNAWPQRLDRGDTWPWAGVWNDAAKRRESA